MKLVEIVCKCISTQFGRDESGSQNGFYLRGKNKLAAWSGGVVKRFFSKAVASGYKRLGGVVPQRKRKHAGQLFYKLRAVLIVKCQNDFSVGVCLKFVV